MVAFIIFSWPLESEAKVTDAYTPQQQRRHTRRSLFGDPSSNNGPGKPNNNESGGDDDDNGLPQYSKPESVETTEERVENIDSHIAKLEEVTDSESEEEQCEATEQLQVDESYKSNLALKKITENAVKNGRAMKNITEVKKTLTEGEDPMKIGYNQTNLGNAFYYIRKPNALIIVKLDQTTGNSDIVAVVLRSNEKNMEKFATIVNAQFDTKLKINPNAY